MLDSILENFPDDPILKADGFDEAVIGIDTNSMRLVYSVSKCISILEDEGLSEFEAREHFSFNIEGGFVGEQTPIWCHDDIGQ